MLLPLLLSSVAAGFIATSVMVFFLYLPLAWGGNFYDVLGALGSAVTGKLDGRARFLGTIVYFAGGILFSIFYGWAVMALMGPNTQIPELVILPSFPVQINLFYPILGLALGLGHGILVAFLVTIVVIEHHPMEQFRARFILVISQLISHVAFGVTVMFFQHQFLQLFMGSSAA